MGDLSCACMCDLENWNFGFGWLKYCPNCGAELSEYLREALRDKIDNEISDMIRGKLLDMFDSCRDELSADELPSVAWEMENCNGVVFYNNWEADKFVMRHLGWVDDAMDHICDMYGDAECYMKMRAGCNDRFLVVAFIEATEAYLYGHFGIDVNEGGLTKKRVKEIIGLIKEAEYDGRF